MEMLFVVDLELFCMSPDSTHFLALIEDIGTFCVLTTFSKYSKETVMSVH